MQGLLGEACNNPAPNSAASLTQSIQFVPAQDSASRINLTINLKEVFHEWRLGILTLLVLVVTVSVSQGSSIRAAYA